MSGFKESLSLLDESLTSGLRNLLDGVENLQDSFAEFARSYLDFFESLQNSIAELCISFVEGIEKIFIPPEDLFENKVNDLRSRFSFADSIIATVSFLGDMIVDFADGEMAPPSVSMDIDIYGTVKKVTIIDLSWYAPFKSYGDMVMSGLMYAFFTWRVFVRLPGIIAGHSGVSDMIASYMFTFFSKESKESSGSSKSSHKGGKT